MATLKRKRADGTWEYIQLTGADVVELNDNLNAHIVGKASPTTLGHVKAETDAEGNLILPVLVASNVESTDGNVQTDIDDLKSSVSDGKTLVKNAITGKGGTVLDADGDGVSTFAELSDGVNGIQVGDYAIGDFVSKYSYTEEIGQETRTGLISTSTATTYTPMGVELHPSDDLIVVANDSTVRRVTQVNVVVWSYAMTSTVTTSFAGGSVFSVDNDGNVYVGDTGGKVYKINGDTGLLIWVYQSPGTYAGYVRVDDNGNVYFSQLSNGQGIWKISNSGTYIATNSNGGGGHAIDNKGQVIFKARSQQIIKMSMSTLADVALSTLATNYFDHVEYNEVSDVVVAGEASSGYCSTFVGATLSYIAKDVHFGSSGNSHRLIGFRVYDNGKIAKHLFYSFSPYRTRVVVTNNTMTTEEKVPVDVTLTTQSYCMSRRGTNFIYVSFGSNEIKKYYNAGYYEKLGVRITK